MLSRDRLAPARPIESDHGHRDSSPPGSRRSLVDCRPSPPPGTPGRATHDHAQAPQRGSCRASRAELAARVARLGTSAGMPAEAQVIPRYRRMQKRLSAGHRSALQTGTADIKRKTGDIPGRGPHRFAAICPDQKPPITFFETTALLRTTYPTLPDDEAGEVGEVSEISGTKRDLLRCHPVHLVARSALSTATSCAPWQGRSQSNSGTTLPFGCGALLHFIRTHNAAPMGSAPAVVTALFGGCHAYRADLVISATGSTSRLVVRPRSSRSPRHCYQLVIRLPLVLIC